MEFAFEDSLFETNTDKDKLKTQTQTKYVPKQCYNEWFAESVINENSSLEDCMEYTHNADLHFYRKQYKEAKEKYCLLLSCKICHASNPIMRELHENIIRCCLKLNEFNEALLYLKPLFALHGNSNDCSINCLACTVYCVNELHKEAVHQAMIAVNVNQMHPKLWLNLYDMILLLLQSGVNSIIIENEECSFTDNLLYRLLTQAKFLLNESLRGQHEAKLTQYKPISDEIENKTNDVVTRNPHLQKCVGETVCPVVNVHEGVQSNQSLCAASFVWNWCKKSS